MKAVCDAQLSALKLQLAETCGMTAHAMQCATQALLNADLVLAQYVIFRQQAIARMSAHVEKTSFLMMVSEAPDAVDLATLVSATCIAADAEQMGAEAARVAEIARGRHPQCAVPGAVSGCITPMSGLAVVMATGVADLQFSRDPLSAARIRHAGDAMEELHRQLLAVPNSCEWTDGVAAGVDVALLGRLYGRFGDHAVKVARHVIVDASGRHQ